MDRKLDVGGTLSHAFSVYGSQAGVLIPLALGLFLIVAIVNGLVAGTLILLPLGFAVSVAASTLYVGMVVTAVGDMEDGKRDYSIGDLVNSATPVILPLIGAGIVAGLLIGIGLVLFVIPGLYLLTIWAVIGPAIVLERKGVFESFTRSHQLVKGDGWRVFGVILSVFVIVFVVQIVLSAIAVSIADSAVVRIIFNWIGSSLTAPITAIVAAVIYFQLRGVKEGGASDVPTTPAPPAVPPPATPPPAV